MNARDLFSGGILVLLGILFLGTEFHWFKVDWNELFRFWPLLLIYLGITLLVGKTSTTSTILTVMLLCIAVPAAVVSSCKNEVSDKIANDFNIDFDDDDNDNDDNNDGDNDNDDSDDSSSSTGKGGGVQKLTESMDANTKTAVLNFSGGASEFSIKNSTTQLIDVDADLDFGNVSIKKSQNGTEANVDFALKGKKNNLNFNSDDKHNKIDIKLNDKPEWDMNFEFGAGEADFDLSPYKVKKLSIKTGVTKTEVKLGDKVDNLDVNVESGLTSIEFKVPQAVGCRIKVEGGLNSKDFDGFTKKEDGYYETSNYGSASKKIDIKFEGGLQELKVSVY